MYDRVCSARDQILLGDIFDLQREINSFIFFIGIFLRVFHNWEHMTVYEAVVQNEIIWISRLLQV